MIHYGNDRQFEEIVERALARRVERSNVPESTWTEIESRFTANQPRGHRIRNFIQRLDQLFSLKGRIPVPVPLVLLAAVVIAFAALGTWIQFFDNRAPAIDQIGTSTNAVQVWELEDGTWLTGGEALASFSARFESQPPRIGDTPPLPGSDAAFLADALAGLAHQDFSVTSTASPFSQVPQAMHLESLDPLRDDGTRQWLDPSRVVVDAKCEVMEDWIVVEFPTPTANLPENSYFPLSHTPIIVRRCMVVDSGTGAVLGESYYGPASATSTATFNSLDDFTLHKESRPSSPIPIRGISYQGTVTDWRMHDGQLERRTELDTGTNNEAEGAGEWVDDGIRFESGSAAIDWLLATQFYAPINRPSGSLLSAPFDSVERVEDAGLDGPLARFEAVREQGPSGREKWVAVIAMEQLRPVTMTITTGDGNWQQSAEFEFSYP